MRRVSVTAAGSSASSASYEGTATVGQASPAGAASFCNAGYVAGFGFWSVLGGPPVPIRLSVAKTPGDSPYLFWTGIADSFDVHVSPAPDDVLDPSHLVAVTQGCTFTDNVGGTADLYFYVVIATPD